MFKKYIPELQKRFSVPDECVIAGGAIANTIFNLEHGTDAPIRDIDIYHFETDVAVNNFNVTRIITGEYDSLTIAGMTLKEVVEDEKLQHIYLTTDASVITPAEKLWVIRSFDLNCVQVAFDGERLFWTQEFEEFIKTKQLKVVHVHNTKTFFRLFKKQEDLGAYFNYDATVELFSQLQASHKQVFNPYMADTYIPTVEKWFPLLKNIVVVNNKINFPLPKYKLGKLIDVAQMISLVEYVTSAKKGVRQRFLEVIQTYPNVGAMLRLDPTGFTTNITNKQLASMEHVYAEHPLIYSQITGKYSYRDEQEIDVTLEDHLCYTNTLHSLEKQYGRFVYGVVENEIDLLYDLDGLKKVLDTQLKELKKPLVEPLPTVDVPGFRITELTTGLHLKDEGDRLKHCVGGYSNAIKNNNSRIFSLQTEKARTTLQLTYQVKDDVAVFTIAQHAAVLNGSVSPSFGDAANELVKQLNNMKLKLPNKYTHKPARMFMGIPF